MVIGPIGVRGAGLAAKAIPKAAKGGRGLLSKAKNALAGTPGRAATTGFFARDALDLAPGTSVQFAGHTIGDDPPQSPSEEPDDDGGPSFPFPLEYVGLALAGIAAVVAFAGDS